MITIRNSVNLFSYQVCILLRQYFDLCWYMFTGWDHKRQDFRFQRQDGLAFSFWWFSRDDHQITRIIKLSADAISSMSSTPGYQAPQLTLSRDAPQWEMPHNVPWGHWWLMVNHGQATQKAANLKLRTTELAIARFADRDCHHHHHHHQHQHQHLKLSSNIVTIISIIETPWLWSLWLPLFSVVINTWGLGSRASTFDLSCGSYSGKGR